MVFKNFNHQAMTNMVISGKLECLANAVTEKCT